MIRFLTCAAVVGIGCAQAACPTWKQPEHPEYWELSPEEQRTALLEYPPEEQVDIYLYGVEMWHPPRLDLADPLASNGEAVLPSLLDRLEGAETASRKEALLYVLEVMSCRYHNLSGNERVIWASEKAVESMEAGTWREMSAKHLANLRRPPGTECELSRPEIR